ncbi:hypothetical protein HK101_000315, partial [Irineochytrium annulatum]
MIIGGCLSLFPISSLWPSSSSSAPSTPTAPVQTIPPHYYLLVNGILHTVDDGRPQASAMAVRDGLILEVGDDSPAMRDRHRAARVLDLQGRTVVPGLIDSHAHLLNQGRYLMEADVVGSVSIAEI